MKTIQSLQAQISTLNNSIDNLKEVIQSLNSQIDNFEYVCSENEYDEFLDEIYEEVFFGGISFSPSYIMRNLDPVAYRCGKSDYESNYDLDNCKEYTDLQKESEEKESELYDLESELYDLENELSSLED